MLAKTINRNPEWVDIVQFSDSGENLGRAHVQKVVKTDEEWLRQLGQEAFDITRRADTELACTGRFWKNHDNGLYRCICCDTALFLTLFSIWTENTLPVSMAAVGILVPQFFWCVDFGAELLGFHLTGMTSYMFDPHRSLFLRGLSLFHGWLPFLLVFLVLRLGYDRRALKAWTALASALCLVAFFLLPPAGAQLADPKLPLNVNLVFGFNDAHPQTWMPPGLYLIVWMLALFTLAYVPTDWMLKKSLLQRASQAALARPTQPNVD